VLLNVVLIMIESVKMEYFRSYNTHGPSSAVKCTYNFDDGVMMLMHINNFSLDSVTCTTKITNSNC
jgi:hypothetical protein